MKLYYAYENWTARAYSAHDVTVHLRECAHCPFDAEGGRRGPEPSGANDCWHLLGRYEMPRDAMRARSCRRESNSATAATACGARTKTEPASGESRLRGAPDATPAPPAGRTPDRRGGGC